MLAVQVPVEERRRAGGLQLGVQFGQERSDDVSFRPCKAREDECLDITHQVCVVLLRLLFGHVALASDRLRRLVQRGEKRGKLVGHARPFGS